MCSDCEAYGLKKHGLTRSDYICRQCNIKGMVSLSIVHAPSEIERSKPTQTCETKLKLWWLHSNHAGIPYPLIFEDQDNTAIIMFIIYQYVETLYAPTHSHTLTHSHSLSASPLPHSLSLTHTLTHSHSPGPMCCRFESHPRN